MRIERTGQIPPLTPRVERFLKEVLRGVSLDDIQSHEELRPDYSCLGGLLVIELKTLEEDGSARLNNLTDELRERDDWPEFLGSAPMEAFLKNTSDPDGLRRRVLDRIGRALINHLKKANRQLGAHYANFPRRNMVGALLIVNEDHELYDPHTVTHVLQHALRRMENGKRLYEHIDLVLYMTERHAMMVDGQVAFPILIVEGQGVRNAPWKGEVGQYVAMRWAGWNGVPLVESEPALNQFSTIDHIPEVAPRHERWRTDYRRRPYLRSLTSEQLRDRFDEILVLANLAFLSGSPLKPPRDVTTRNMEQFTHMMVEMAERAIPISSFRFEPSRHLDAAKRMNLPDAVIKWLVALERERRGESTSNPAE